MLLLLACRPDPEPAEDTADDPGVVEVVPRGPAEPERCSDGRDNDLDGLLDCEDGDCSGSDRCGEVACDDRVDDDDDGAVDCRDSDCWGTRACAGRVMTRAWTGSGQRGCGRHFADYTYNANSTTYQRLGWKSVSFDRVEGSVVVLGDGDVRVCRWLQHGVRWLSTYQRHTVYTEDQDWSSSQRAIDLRRRTFQMDEGCTSEPVLPPLLGATTRGLDRVERSYDTAGNPVSWSLGAWYLTHARSFGWSSYSSAYGGSWYTTYIDLRRGPWVELSERRSAP